ncbi:MAG: hypothetical protein AMS16_06410, partial [Planctomycetes bacterium DG_58]
HRDTKKPVADGQLRIWYWRRDGKASARRNMRTDEDGRARIGLPDGKLRSLSIIVKKEHLTPLSVGWERRGEHVEIPATFTVELSPGTLIGGTIRNEAGEPITGARVLVSCLGTYALRPATVPHVRPYLNRYETQTDEAGHWRCDIAPEEFRLAHIQLKHPEYVSDHWGPVPATEDEPIYPAQKPNALRELSSVIVMKRGTPVTGVVLDEDGDPIQGATIHWSSAWRQHPIRRTETDEEGRFRLGRLDERKITVFVNPRDLAPDFKDIEVKIGLEPIEFRLKPGRTLRGRVVDADGKPLPNVLVQPGRWRGRSSVFLHYPRTDEEGRFVCPNMPSGEILFRFSQKGPKGLTREKVPLVASDEEHVVTLDLPKGRGESRADETPLFGPVIERVLPFGFPCAMKYIRFRTGDIIAIGTGPEDRSDHAAEFRAAEKGGGIDASALGGELGVQFAGRGCVFASAEKAEHWNALTAEEVVLRLQRETWLKGVLEVPGKDFPATYVFKTALGDCGILQILAVTDNPKGVKIRYKMVQAARGTVVRVYEVLDLLAEIPDFEGPDVFSLRGEAAPAETVKRPAPSTVDPAEELADRAEELIATIQGTVDPGSWPPEGKTGSIRHRAGNLIITQTEENHAAIAALLKRLRMERSLQTSLDATIIELPAGEQAKLRTWMEDELKRPLSEIGPRTTDEMKRPRDQTLGMALLNDPDVAKLLKRVRVSAGVRVTKPPKLTMLSGQRAYVAARTQTPVLLTKRGQPGRTVPVTFNQGYSLDIRATVSPDRKRVTMTLRPWIWKLLAKKPEPLFSFCEVTTTASVPDGMTLVVRMPAPLVGSKAVVRDVKDGRTGAVVRQEVTTVAPDKTAVPQESVYLLIKPTIIIQEEVEVKNTAAWGEAVNGLQCRLLPETQTVEVAEGAKPEDVKVFVTYELRNVGKKPVKFLPWIFPAPLYELGGGFHVVGPDGAAVRGVYSGKAMEGRRLKPEDFVALAPGGTSSVRIMLPYDFTKPGAYQISYGITRNVAPEGQEIEDYYAGDLEKAKQNPDNVWTGTLKSNTVTVNVVRKEEAAWGEAVEGLRCAVEPAKATVPFGKWPWFRVTLTNVTETPIDVVGLAPKRVVSAQADRTFHVVPCVQIDIEDAAGNRTTHRSHDLTALPVPETVDDAYNSPLVPTAVRIEPKKSWTFEAPLRWVEPAPFKPGQMPELGLYLPGKYTARVTYAVHKKLREWYEKQPVVFGKDAGELAGKKPARLWEGAVQAGPVAFEVIRDDSEQLEILTKAKTGEGVEENLVLELKVDKTVVRPGQMVQFDLTAHNVGHEDLHIGSTYALTVNGPDRDVGQFHTSRPDLVKRIKPGSSMKLDRYIVPFGKPLVAGKYEVQAEYVRPASRQKQEVLKKSNTVTVDVVKQNAAEAPADRTVWLELEGRVIDDETGEPIQAYALRLGSGTEYFTGRDDGGFRSRTGWWKGAKLRARILADGYLPEPVTAKPLTPPASVTNLVVRLKRGGTVRGQVLDHRGKPVVGAKVFLVGRNMLTLTDGEPEFFHGSKTETDEEGRFELTGLGPESRSLVASSPSLHAWSVPVPKGGRDATIRLPEPARLRIRYDIEGDLPEARFYLELATRLKKLTGVVGAQRPTAPNKGETVLENVMPGEYDLSRMKPLRIGDWGSTALLDRRKITCEAGETLTVDFVRRSGHPITGELTGLKGTGVPGAAVFVKAPEATDDPYKHDSPFLTIFDAVTCPVGVPFKTARIPPGKYKVIAEAYKPERSKGVMRTGW